MTPQDENVYKQILQKDYPLKDFKSDDFVELGAEITEQREVWQRVLGKMALEINRRGESVDEFAQKLEDYSGRSIPRMSIRVAMWVEKKIEGLDIPEDIQYYALKTIAGTAKPKTWLDKVNKQGLSSAQVVREIQGGGQRPKGKICKNCGTKQPATCIACNKPL